MISDSLITPSRQGADRIHNPLFGDLEVSGDALHSDELQDDSSVTAQRKTCLLSKHITICVEMIIK